MSLQAERTLQQEVAWRLKPLPILALPIPNGLWIPARNDAERSIVARVIARMKADGMLLPGAPDLVLLWRGGAACVELKRPKSVDLLGARPAGRPNNDQRFVAECCAALGVPHAYCTSWDELRQRLTEWGAPP